MQLRLIDVIGGTFVARPLEDVCEDDGSIKITLANVFGKADEPVQLHSPEPAPVVTQVEEPPKVTTGQVTPPWELAAKKVDAQPIETVKEEAEVTQALAVPWEKPVTVADAIKAIGEGGPIPDRGIPEGFGLDDPEKLIELNGYKFATQQDASDWVIAKGRALPYSTLDDTRPDPFFVPDMYKMLEQKRNSHLIGHTVTSFRIACRHAIAMSVLYHDQDIERYESALRAQREAMQTDEAQAAHIRWKQAIEKRKNTLIELDREVAEARDAWHALRK